MFYVEKSLHNLDDVLDAAVVSMLISELNEQIEWDIDCLDSISGVRPNMAVVLSHMSTNLTGYIDFPR